MGWTTCFNASFWKYDKKGNRTVDRRKECDKMLTWEAKDSDGKVLSIHRVLKSAMVGSTYYAAVTSEREGQPTKVWAAVFLTCGKSRTDGTVWGYKDMDESMGPYYYECPASILALLTPTDNEDALKWREECRKHIAKKAEERKAGPKPLYAPKGVEVRTEGRSWIVRNANVLATGYSGVRYTKARWRDFDVAMKHFLAKYGTGEQKREFARSGRECPEEWKGAAA